MNAQDFTTKDTLSSETMRLGQMLLILRRFDILQQINDGQGEELT